MNFIEFTASRDDDDRRLDKILRKFLPEIELNSVYKNIRKGFIKVNKKKSKPENHVFENDVISIADFLLEKKENQHLMVSPNVSVEDIFVNEHIRIINKPYDVNVHKAQKDEVSIQDIIKEDFEKKGNVSLSFSPGPLHRLDRKTTGILCFSQSLKGASWFSDAMKKNLLEKRYLGIASGKMLKEALWIDYTEKNDDENQGFHTMKISREKTEENKNITHVRPLAYGKFHEKDITLAEYFIETGKTHQIRFQSSLHGFPLLGDSAYGGGSLSGEARDFFLHAFYLKFPKDNPIGLKEKYFAPLPSDFKTFLNNYLLEKEITLYNETVL